MDPYRSRWYRQRISTDHPRVPTVHQPSQSLVSCDSFSTESLLSQLLSEEAQPHKTVYCTSRLPKIALTPELGNRLKALKMYRAFMQVDKQRKSSMGYRQGSHTTRPRYVHRKLTQSPQRHPRSPVLRAMFLTQDSESPFASPPPPTLPLYPLKCVSIGGNRQSPLSRESHSSVQTPLRPVYSLKDGVSAGSWGQRPHKFTVIVPTQAGPLSGQPSAARLK